MHIVSDAEAYRIYISEGRSSMVSPTPQHVRALVDKIIAEWADKGQLIEGGWRAYVAINKLESAPALQHREMRTVYFLGAQHLWASMMSVLDPDAEPTEKDLKLMGLINEELETFRQTVLVSSPAATPTEPTKPTLGDGPIEAEHQQRMVELAAFLDQEFNGPVHGPARQTGFVLLVFPFHGHGGRANYISNGADRKDIITLFTEQIARFKGSPDQTGRA